VQNISQQYRELKEGKISKYQFLHNARTMFPAYITNMNSLEDSIKILKNKGLLNEGEAVKGTPDKSPIYDYPDSLNRKYKKVEQSPEIEEQDGIYPATSLTDIPKPQREKRLSKVSDGLQPLKEKDEKNGMKKVRIRLVKESKKTLNESLVPSPQEEEQLVNKIMDMIDDNYSRSRIISFIVKKLKCSNVEAINFLNKHEFILKESPTGTKKGTKVFRDVELSDSGNEYMMNVIVTYEYTSDDTSENPSYSISKIDIRLEDVEKYEYKNNNWILVLDEDQIVKIKTKVQEENMDEFKEEILKSFDSNDNDIV